FLTSAVVGSLSLGLEGQDRKEPDPKSPPGAQARGKRNKAAMLPTRSKSGSSLTYKSSTSRRMAAGIMPSETSSNSRVLRPQSGQYRTMCESRWEHPVHSTARAE